MHHGPEFTLVLLTALVLTAGAALRQICARLGIPYTMSVLLAGLGAGLAAQKLPHDAPGYALAHLAAETSAGVSPYLILFVFLPVLVFESAFAMEVHTFRRNIGAVLLLAGPTLVASTIATAALMVGLTAWTWQWSWTAALVFGALISATDPVAVVALLREVGAPKRLGVLIEGESLLNDGTSIVVFTVLMASLTGGGTDPVQAVVSFGVVAGGGIAVGLVLAALASTWLANSFNAPLVEITVTVVLAYAAMIVAEGLLGVSGVLAVVTAGLWLSGPGRVHISPEVAHFLHQFWEMLAYFANTVIFFLVGLVVAEPIGHTGPETWALVLAAWLGLVLLRFGLFFLMLPALNRVGDPITVGQASVMAWGGLRGAVSLALALMVMQNHAVPEALREQMLVVTAGVVLLTILVNGGEMSWVLRRFGFDKVPPDERMADITTRAAVLRRVRAALVELGEARDLRTVDWSSVEEMLDAQQVDLKAQLEEARAELASLPSDSHTHGVWRRVLEVERHAYWNAFAHGTLGARATQILDEEIDLQLDRLDHGIDTPPDRRAGDLPGWRGRLERWLQQPGRSPTWIQFDILSLRYDLWRAEGLAADSVLEHVERLHDLDPALRDDVLRTYRRYRHDSKRHLEDLRSNLPEITGAIETRLAQRIELNLERDTWAQLAHEGAIDPSTAANMRRAIEQRMKQLNRGVQAVELPETADLCRDAPMFRHLDQAALQHLADLTVEKALPEGAVLFAEGAPGDSMYVIARGACGVFREGEDGQVLVDVLGGGDILGEMALLTGSPRNATIRAITTVTVGEISRDGFEALLDQQPRLRDAVWHGFARRAFDNHLRNIEAFEHLGRDERRAWFEQGELHTLPADAPVPCSDGYLFVVSGDIHHHGQPHPAPAFLRIHPADRAPTALGPARVLVLPDAA